MNQAKEKTAGAFPTIWGSLMRHNDPANKVGTALQGNVWIGHRAESKTMPGGFWTAAGGNLRKKIVFLKNGPQKLLKTKGRSPGLKKRTRELGTI
jgi:hypothetical protein